MNLLYIVIFGLIVAAMCCFILTLLLKWKVAEWYQAHRRPWMPKPCRFCFFFWIGIVISLLHFLAGSFTLTESLVCAMVIPIFALFLFRNE